MIKMMRIFINSITNMIGWMMNMICSFTASQMITRVDGLVTGILENISRIFRIENCVFIVKLQQKMPGQYLFSFRFHFWNLGFYFHFRLTKYSKMKMERIQLVSLFYLFRKRKTWIQRTYYISGSKRKVNLNLLTVKYAAAQIN